MLRLPQNGPGAFPYPVFGRFTYVCLPLVYIVLFMFWRYLGAFDNVHQIQSAVREKPDTGYRKSPRTILRQSLFRFMIIVFTFWVGGRFWLFFVRGVCVLLLGRLGLGGIRIVGWLGCPIGNLGCRIWEHKPG